MKIWAARSCIFSRNCTSLRSLFVFAWRTRKKRENRKLCEPRKKLAGIRNWKNERSRNFGSPYGPMEKKEKLKPTSAVCIPECNELPCPLVIIGSTKSPKITACLMGHSVSSPCKKRGRGPRGITRIMCCVISCENGESRSSFSFALFGRDEGGKVHFALHFARSSKIGWSDLAKIALKRGWAWEFGSLFPRGFRLTRTIFRNVLSL